MNKASLSQKMNKEEITTVDEIMPIEKMKNDMKEFFFPCFLSFSTNL